MTREEIAADIAMQIRVLMVKRGLSQQRLGERIGGKNKGTAHTRVSMMLSRGGYGLKSLVEIADALGVKLTVRFE